MATYDVMIGNSPVVVAETPEAAGVIVEAIKSVRSDLRNVHGLVIRSVETDRDRRDAFHAAKEEVDASMVGDIVSEENESGVNEVETEFEEEVEEEEETEEDSE